MSSFCLFYNCEVGSRWWKTWNVRSKPALCWLPACGTYAGYIVSGLFCLEQFPNRSTVHSMFLAARCSRHRNLNRHPRRAAESVLRACCSPKEIIEGRQSTERAWAVK